jgi:hypothetical protein
MLVSQGQPRLGSRHRPVCCSSTVSKVQPDLIMALMLSQQAWIIAYQVGSPHMMPTPFSVASHLRSPMVWL